MMGLFFACYIKYKDLYFLMSINKHYKGYKCVRKELTNDQSDTRIF